MHASLGAHSVEFIKWPRNPKRRLFVHEIKQPWLSTTTTTKPTTSSSTSSLILSTSSQMLLGDRMNENSLKAKVCVACSCRGFPQNVHGQENFIFAALAPTISRQIDFMKFWNKILIIYSASLFGWTLNWMEISLPFYRPLIVWVFSNETNIDIVFIDWDNDQFAINALFKARKMNGTKSKQINLILIITLHSRLCIGFSE